MSYASCAGYHALLALLGIPFIVSHFINCYRLEKRRRKSPPNSNPSLSQMDSDWSNLPKDLLVAIIKRLPFITDYIRFSAVCKFWHSVASDNRHYLPRQLPFLMIHVPNENTNVRQIYSLPDRRILASQLPVPHQKRCRGSTDGWLTTIDEDLSMHLFNPFSNMEILLPPMTTIPNPFNDILCRDSFIQKAVLSSNPVSAPDYVVIIIYGSRGKLAFFKPGNRGWMAIESQHCLFDDVLYYRGQLYAVNCSGRVVVCNVVGPYPVALEVFPTPIPVGNLMKRYLVESMGELLQVVRDFVWEANDDEDDVYRTAGFEVFKLNLSDPQRWVKVKSLNDQMLFIGDNTSFSVSASDFPGCRGNCIYFTDDIYEQYMTTPLGSYDMGVFYLEDGRNRPLYPISDSVVLMPPPIWISPM